MKRPTETRAHYDERIVQYIEGKRINIDGIHNDRKDKEEFIRNVLGYERLRVGKDEFVPISQCNDTRISSVAREAYSAAKRRLKKS
jgi:predicted adenine nucleotide alpha hydrolase (AANH) superfamily ATPase